MPDRIFTISWALLLIVGLVLSCSIPLVQGYPPLGQLLDNISLQLDFCSSQIAPHPPCRHLYNYWFWDDPNTPFAPDKIFIHGGISGPDASQGFSVNLPILADFWVLNITSTDDEWSFSWSCLTGCTAKYPNTYPGQRCGAFAWNEASGALWLQAGYGRGMNFANNNGNAPGYLRDLWKYDVNSGSWIAVRGPYGSVETEERDVSNPVKLPNTAGGVAWTQDTHAYLYPGAPSSVTATVSTIHLQNNDLGEFEPVSPRPTPRVGALTYSEPTMLYLYGGVAINNSSLIFDDLWRFNITGNNWTKLCNPSCSLPTDCFICDFIQSTSLLAHLKNARLINVANSTGDSRLVVIGGATFDTNSTSWQPNLEWVQAAGPFISNPNTPPANPIPPPICDFMNPFPANPYLAQCVNNRWLATALCDNCVSDLIIASNGTLVTVEGNWNPNSLNFRFVPGGFLNVTGDLSMRAVTSTFVLDDAQFDYYSTETRSSFPIIESSSNLIWETSAPEVSSKPSVTRDCVSSSISTATWSVVNNTQRTTVSVDLVWKKTTIPECQPSKNRVVLISTLAAGGVLAILLLALIVYKRPVFIQKLWPMKSKEGKQHQKESQIITNAPNRSIDMTGNASTINTKEVQPWTLVPILPTKSQTKFVVSNQNAPAEPESHRSSMMWDATPRSGVSRSDLDYESGFGSLENSLEADFENGVDLNYVPDLSRL